MFVLDFRQLVGWSLAFLLLVGAVHPVSAQPVDASMSIARVKYGGGGDWYSDEQSLPELLAFVRQNTLLDVSPEAEVVELTSDKLFSFPYVYLTGHGNISLTPAEVERLRQYLIGGGFLHIDDNYGLDPYIRRELGRLFPKSELIELPFDHPIYHCWFDFPEGPPKIHEHDGEPPQGYGLFVDGRLVVYYTHECDLGDGWEDPAVHRDPPEVREAALRMGVNIVVYALTH